MSENRPPSDEQWETFVRDTARDFTYPPTPDVSLIVQQPSRPARIVYRWRLLAAALLVVFLAAMAVPEVRAAVLEVLRIGAVRIFLIEPAHTPSQTPPITTSTPGTPSPVFNLPGETSLERIRARLEYPILLPSEFKQPDRVFLQYMGGAVVTLVWADPADTNTAEWVLQILDREVSASKEMYQGQPQPVTVNGRRGVWLEEVHEIVFYGMNGDNRRLIQANVMVWEIDGITYRLETQHPLEDALRVAESLR